LQLVLLRKLIKNAQKSIVYENCNIASEVFRF
jgi:hypothetical protein